MTKLIVNNPQGFQEIIEVGSGGGYFDTSLVVFDERKDGPMPASMEKPIRDAMALRAAVIATEEARRLQVVQNRRSRVLALARKIKDGTISAAERNEGLGLLLLDMARELD